MEERENQERGMRAIEETGGKTLTRNQKHQVIPEKAEHLPLKKGKTLCREAGK